MVKEKRMNRITNQNITNQNKRKNNKRNGQNKPSKLRLVKGKDGVWRVIHEKTLYEIGVVF